jgi:UDP-N-acetylglucosamine 2-epimerase (non-hydrolysing)
LPGTRAILARRARPNEAVTRPLAVLAVIGTRPEAVKTAPVVRLLRDASDFRVRLLSTGQHRELLSAA